MVEAGANEVTEAEILDALDIAHGAIKELCQAQHDLRKQAGKEKVEITPPQVDEALSSEIKDRFGAALDAATQVQDKLERQDATKRVEEEVLEALGGDAEDGAERRAAVQLAFDKLEKDIIRQRIAVDKKRPDGRAAGRDPRHLRSRSASPPRTHGSAIFTRGQTQAFSVAALGTTRDEMRLDTLGLQEKKHYFHHYNFPPFSVGEAGFMRGPKRRDIGHGALAERALVPVVPTVEDFPYTIRVVSDILESNGSSSMASVCGSSAVADGRRRADQGAGGGHRDGPDQGGRRLRRAHRHRGRGGPPRRHGLQGRRHVGGHHRPPDGHQDHGRHVRHPARRARAGQERAARHPRQDDRGHLGAARASCRSTRRGSARSRSTPRRSAR